MSTMLSIYPQEDNPTLEELMEKTILAMRVPGRIAAGRLGLCLPGGDQDGGCAHSAPEEKAGLFLH